MPKLFLVNGWTDDNKGDGAIVMGLISLLKEVCEEHHLPLQIKVGSSFAPAAIGRHYRHTSRMGDYPVVGALLPTVPQGGHVLRRRSYSIWLLLRSLLLLAWPKGAALLLSAEERKTLAAFFEADLVVSKGGHKFVSRGGIWNLVGLYKNLFPLLLAQRLGKPSAIFGQSIGPIKMHTLSSWLFRRLLLNLECVYVREPLSLELVRSLLGKPGKKDKDRPIVDLTWDTAFGIVGQALPATVTARLPERFAVVTVRPWAFPEHGSSGANLYDRYLDAMADAIVELSAEGKLQMIAVPQVIGPYAAENDIPASNELARRVGVRGGNLAVIDEDLEPGQLKELYAMADFILGTRFHSVILSLASGTPAIAVSYYGPKTKGIMSMLGLDDFVLDIESISKEGIKTRVSRLSGLDRGELSLRVKGVRAETRMKVEQMLAASELLPAGTFRLAPDTGRR